MTFPFLRAARSEWGPAAPKKPKNKKPKRTKTIKVKEKR